MPKCTLFSLRESIGDLIHASALRTHGGARSSALDASGWQRLCTSFGTVSNGLCNALALLARHLCTEVLDFDSLQAYVACRLVLDKRPGVRPIGICEVAIITVIGGDI